MKTKRTFYIKKSKLHKYKIKYKAGKYVLSRVQTFVWESHAIKKDKDWIRSFYIKILQCSL